MTLQLQHWEQTLLMRAGEGTLQSYADTPQISGNPELLLRAYSVCEALTAEHSRSFYLASALLPKPKRLAVRALYAFCRITDDIVDDGGANAAIELRHWRHKVERGHVSQDDLVVLAWTDARTRYNIPARYMSQLIDGVACDLHHAGYSTFGELADYAYGVASTVGLMSMHVIGFETDEAIAYAIKLGVALQLTNILRDVGQDWRMGRIYLPQDELDAFGISHAELDAGLISDRWRAFMRYQIGRNRRLYTEAWPGIEMLNSNGRFAIAAAADLYRAILGDIEAHDYDVFSRRAYVGTWGKLSRLPQLYVNVRRSGR